MHKFNKAIIGKDTISIIAEIKKYSPSYGKPFPSLNIPILVQAYEAGGADAISVVTAPDPFLGSLALLEEARTLTTLPLLRKDFIKTKEDVKTSKSAGADAVLLLAHLLDDSALSTLIDYATELELDVLLETHTKEELMRAISFETVILGINNRNLKTFSTDVSHAAELLPSIPKERAVVAESAFRRPQELAAYQGTIDAVLIGTAFLISQDPQKTLTEFTNVSRPS